jgi:hypothetical protein
VRRSAMRSPVGYASAKDPADLVAATPPRLIDGSLGC